MADWERTADPWFVVNTDPGHPGGYHVHPTWAEAPDVPLAAVREYVRRLDKGEAIDRPTDDVLRERDRIAGEYRELMAEDDRPVFDETLALARKVFVYIEEHVLYIEHWMWAAFWAKSKELSRALAAMGELDEPEDMFFLRRYEVAEAIYDCVVGWSVGSRPRGADYWRPIVATRRRIYDALRAWEPRARARPAARRGQRAVHGDALGHHDLDGRRVAEAPTTRAARCCAAPAGRPGVVEGPVRVVTHVGELGVGASPARCWSARPRRRRGRRCSPGSRPRSPTSAGS